MRLLLACLLSGSAWAAVPPSDALAAMVGDQPIFLSEVREAAEQLSAYGAATGTLAQRGERALSQLIDDKIVLLRAKAETLQVADAEISPRLDDQFKQLSERAGGTEAMAALLKQRLHLTPGQYRARLLRQFREERLKEKVREKYVGRIEPSREDILAFFREYKDSLPELPNQVRLSQILIKVKPSAQREEEARKLAVGYIEQLRQGADFGQLAKENSEDPGSKDSAGDIGFFKRGDLDPAYEKAALGLEIGRYTLAPVRSHFGWHVIELVAKRDQEFRTRHILRSLLPGGEDSLRARSLVDSLRQVANAGADFASLARQYSDEKGTASFGGTLGWFPEEGLGEQIGAEMAQKVNAATSGQVLEPIFTRDAYLLLRLDSRVKSRRLTTDEDWMQLSRMAERIISQKKMASYIERWKGEVSVDRRLDPEALKMRLEP